MHHRSKRKVFDGKDGNNSSITNISSLLQKLRTSSTLTKKTLHSKSTYFYRWGSSDGNDSSNRNSTNEFRERSRNRIPYGAVISTRARRETNSYSRIADWRSKLPRLSYVIPSVCTLALLIGGIITINPLANNTNKVFAEEPANSTEGEAAAQANTAPTVSLGLEGAAVQETPAKVGEIAYRSNIFKVGGTGMSKYTVTLNTPAGKTGELVGRSNPYATVGKVGNNTAPANFGDNTWGYAVSTLGDTGVADKDMSYNPVPSGLDSTNNSVEIAKRGVSRTDNVDDSYKITFAAKLGSELPADHYEADVYLSVVASPQSTISSIVTMQEIDSSICSASAEHETKQLKDTRDNKLYWVAKLKDGNCWMTQNLDYDGGGTKQQDLTKWNGSGVTYGTAAYYDPGDYYYNGPSNKHSQGTACTNTTGLSTCSQFSTSGSDRHYHVGNYYSWAATGLCPTGWKLPNSNSYSSISQGLATAYGWSSSNTSSSIMNNGKGIYGAPLYFVFGGRLYNGKIEGAGSSGYYNLGQPNGTPGDVEWPFVFDSAVSFPSIAEPYYGLSVRCIAR